MTVAENSEISWTDATYNPWIGCTKVGPGCDNCYAERDFDLRKGRVKWGPGNPRSRTKTERQPHAWNNAHPDFFAENGRRRRVFSASLADIFDNEVPTAWRADFWNTIAETPCLEWYIVTKRISNVEKMLPTPWAQDLFGHIVLLVTVVNQDEADRDVPRLLALKANYPWLRVGLSIEPMLGPMQIERHLKRWTEFEVDFRTVFPDADAPPPPRKVPRVDWIICGGESGPHARPMHPDWARSLRDQCAEAGVAFHHKQNGEFAPGEIAGEYLDPEKPAKGMSWTGTLEGWHETWSEPDGHIEDEPDVYRIGKKRAGRKLDGVEHNGFPESAQ